MINYKKPALLAAALLVTAGGGFAFGRYSTPEKVVEREKVKIEYVTKEVVVVQEKIKVEKIYLADTKKAVHREERIIEHPNGMKETTKTEDINVEKVVKQYDVQYVDRDVLKVVENKSTETREKEKIVESKKPQWLVGANIGKKLDLSSPLVYGVTVDHRFIGPTYIGAGVNSDRVFSIGLKLEL